MARLGIGVLVLCALAGGARPASPGWVAGHPLIKPMPGAALAGKSYYHEHGALPIPYRDGEVWRERKVYGGYVYLDYAFRKSSGELDTSVTATAILDFYEAETRRLNGRVHRRAPGRLSFSVRRPGDGGRTWCSLWAKAGVYGIDILDEPGTAAAGEASERERPGRG